MLKIILLNYIIGFLITFFVLVFHYYRKELTLENLIVLIITGIIWPIFIVWIFAQIIKEKINKGVNSR